jgi:hypothetical protein
VAAVIDNPIGSSDNPSVGDRVVEQALRHAGAHAAPHAEAPKGKVLGGGHNAALLREQMLKSLARPRVVPKNNVPGAKAASR